MVIFYWISPKDFSISVSILYLFFASSSTDYLTVYWIFLIVSLIYLIESSNLSLSSRDSNLSLLVLSLSDFIAYSVSSNFFESLYKETILGTIKLEIVTKRFFFAFGSSLRLAIRSLMLLTLVFIVYLTFFSYSISEDMSLSLFSASAFCYGVNIIWI